MTSSVTSELPALPDFPMPPGRAEVRRLALRRELDASAGVRSRRRRVVWKVAVLGAATAAIAGAFVARGLMTNQTSVTASWTAIPTSLSGPAATMAEQQCQARLLVNRWPISASAMSGVLAEQRGQLTAALMSGANEYGMCINESGTVLFTGIGEVGAFDQSEGITLDGNPGVLNGADPFRIAYGQVARGVTSVVIDTADGRQVDATVAQGRYFAWWPSGAEPESVTAYAADGGIVKTLNPAPSALTPSPIHQPGTQ